VGDPRGTDVSGWSAPPWPEAGGRKPRRALGCDVATGAAGFVFLGLILATFFTPDIPAADADSAIGKLTSLLESGEGTESTGEQLAAELVAQRTEHQVSVFLGLLGETVFLIFLAGLWSRLRRFEGPGGMLAGTFALGGAVFLSLLLVSDGLYLALVQSAVSHPQVLLTLILLSEWIGVGGIPAAAGMLLGFGGAVLSSRALPIWLGWLGGAAGLLLLVSLVGVFEEDNEATVIAIAGFGGYVLLLAWALATSIVLLLRAGQEPRARATAAPAGWPVGG
jgi:hypothetical protein